MIIDYPVIGYIFPLAYNVTGYYNELVGIMVIIVNYGVNYGLIMCIG
jgi:hypothetical protein